jgi:hypothetical protein
MVLKNSALLNHSCQYVGLILHQMAGWFPEYCVRDSIALAVQCEKMFVKCCISQGKDA